MEFVTKYKDIAEFVYYLSGPLMLIGLVIGLYQLKYLKKDIATRVSRESTLLSVSIMEDKFKELSKLVLVAFNNEKFPYIPEFEGNVSGFIKSDIDCENDWLQEMESGQHSDFEQAVTDCLCCLETMAQYINTGICDDEKCYKLEGPLFIHYVDDLKEHIAFDRENKDDKLYENIISLYQLWSNRLNHDKLLKKRTEINSELIATKRPRALKVIGK